jgi:hypothetical protein
VAHSRSAPALFETRVKPVYDNAFRRAGDDERAMALVQEDAEPVES